MRSLLFIGVLILSTVYAQLAIANDKVTICHIPPGNPANAHTITVSVHAWPAHQAHGDYLGACLPSVTPAEATASPTPETPSATLVPVQPTASSWSATPAPVASSVAIEPAPTGQPVFFPDTGN